MSPSTLPLAVADLAAHRWQRLVLDDVVGGIAEEDSPSMTCRWKRRAAITTKQHHDHLRRSSGSAACLRELRVLSCYLHPSSLQRLRRHRPGHRPAAAPGPAGQADARARRVDRRRGAGTADSTSGPTIAVSTASSGPAGGRPSRLRARPERGRRHQERRQQAGDERRRRAEHEPLTATRDVRARANSAISVNTKACSPAASRERVERGSR